MAKKCQTTVVIYSLINLCYTLIKKCLARIMLNKKAFTLIELLIVIAIIGLLSTLSILALNSARARARDARRVSDVKQSKTALEMYYNENDTYPGALSQLTTTSPPLMRVLPVAPTPVDGSCTTAQNTYTYALQSGSSGSGSASYTLTYCLGSKTGALAGGNVMATPAGDNNYTPAPSGPQPPAPGGPCGALPCSPPGAGP